ncbi:MAG: hypothetical protein EOO63_00540 [Hymenobacter sp.]|nr:MAG: hypothetical protein EOO63_00540 [Hymenobacter sp.]
MLQVITSSQAYWLADVLLATASVLRLARLVLRQLTPFLGLLPTLQNACLALLRRLATGLLATCSYATPAKNSAATSATMMAGPSGTTKTTDIPSWWKKVIAALSRNLHQRGIKLIINQSSEVSAWFKQALTSRTNLCYSYYHWWPAGKGSPSVCQPAACSHSTAFAAGSALRPQPWQTVAVPIC